MEIVLTPDTEARLRARGISHSDLLYAFQNYTRCVPCKEFRGEMKLYAPRGAGQICVRFSQAGEKRLVREAWWTHRR